MTTLPRVLLINDDVDLATMLAQYLTQERFSVQMAHDGKSWASVPMAPSGYKPCAAWATS